MTEVKYRLWDKTNKKMITQQDTASSHAFSIDPFGGLWLNDGTGKRLNDSYELLPFIGVKDITGKDIYEGDIVDVFWPEEVNEEDRYWNNAEICWWDAGFRILENGFGHDPHHQLMKSGESFCDIWEDEDVVQLTVIGNIYENPEMAKD